MRFDRRLIAIAAVAVVMAGCVATGGRVATMAEPGFVARAGQTWAFQPTRPAGTADPRIDNTIVRGALERGLRSAMAARGFVESADPATADLHLAFRIGLTRRTEVRESAPMPVQRQRVVCGPRGCLPVLDLWGWHGPPTPTTRVVDYLEGGVMLDVVEVRSGRLGWRGTIEDRITREALPPQERIDAALGRLVDRLPVDE